MTHSVISHRRRRYTLTAVLVVGALLTLALLNDARQRTGVYWSRVNIQFLAPYSSVNPNVIRARSQSLVMAAGAVARVVDPSGGKHLLADQDVTLASVGYTHAWAVTLPNSGSQWNASFGDPIVQIEVVGTSTDEVIGKMRTLIAAVHTQLDLLQRAKTLPARNAIRLLSTPPGDPPLYFQAGSRIRALTAALALGVAATTLAYAAAARLLRRRPRPPSVPSHGVLVAAGAP